MIIIATQLFVRRQCHVKMVTVNVFIVLIVEGLHRNTTKLSRICDSSRPDLFTKAILVYSVARGSNEQQSETWDKCYCLK